MTPSQIDQVAAIELIQKLQNDAIDDLQTFSSDKVVDLFDYRARREGLSILKRVWQRMYEKLQGPGTTPGTTPATGV